MPFLIFILVFVVLIIVEWIVRPRFYKNKIRKYMSNYGAEILKIERIAFREFIYVVDCLKDNKLEKKTVKFAFWEDDSWY